MMVFKISFMKGEIDYDAYNKKKKIETILYEWLDNRKTNLFYIRNIYDSKKD